MLGKQLEAGTLIEGSRADILILGSSPLDDIDNTRDIRYVISRGRQVRGPDDCSVIIPPVSVSCRTWR